VNYTYDTLNRLTKEAIIDPVDGNRTIEYVYDVVGNRTSRNDSVEGLTTYAYDNNDRLLTETKAGFTTTYVYDRNGNLVSEQSPTKTVVYDWDSENHLMGAITSDATGTHQVQYLYDENGIRVASIRDGVEVRYLVDENQPYAQVIEEYSSTTGTIASYVYGNELVSQIRGSTTSYYLNDGHSGVRLLTDSAGEVTDSYTFDAYGEVIQKTGNTTNDYLYRGEQLDSSVGMQYLRARYYDQNTGRFVSTDPFEGVQEVPISRHRYNYGNDNPIKYLDPSGNMSITEISTTLAIIGILSTVTQSIRNSFVLALSGQKEITWTGMYTSSSVSLLPIPKIIPQLAGGMMFAGLGPEGTENIPFDKRQKSGIWTIVEAGFSVGLPRFNNPYGGSLSVPEDWKNSNIFSVKSPSVFDYHTWVLSGAFNTLSASGYVGKGTSFSLYFLMGFGQANLSLTDEIGLNIGVSAFTGLSIPFSPFF
jgi:RHS repeat-associated protein